MSILIPQRRPKYEFLAETPKEDGTYDLPYWMTVLAGANATTSQTSGHSFRTGFSLDARARNVGLGWGLSIENARNNRVHWSEIDAVNWTLVNTAIFLGQQRPGPSSNVDSIWLADSSGVAIGTATLAGVAGTVGATSVLSAWLHRLARIPDTITTPPVNCTFEASPGAVSTVPWPIPNWARFETPTFVAAVGNSVIVTPSPTAANRQDAVSICHFQQEEGKYPTSFIPTAGLFAARGADVIQLVGPTTLIEGGFFDLDLLIAPAYAQNEMATGAEHNLLFVDANNRLFLRESDKAVVLRLNAVELAVAGQVWARNSTVRVRARHLAGQSQVEINTATGGGSASGPAQPALVIGGAVYMMGTAAGAEEAADVRRISWHAPRT
jgi:hypothetical protein